MFKYLIVLCLTILEIQIVFPQVISRPPHVFNRPVQETVIEAPRNYLPQPYNPLFIETTIPNFSVPVIPPISPSPPAIPIPPASPTSPVATTIITDCSPSVCKNLANTLQLMIVCNLLQNTQGGSDLAVQLAAPIINEVISSPNFSCGCTNPLIPNPSTTVPAIPPTLPPLNVISPTVIPNYVNTPVFNSNGFLYNLL